MRLKHLEMFVCSSEPIKCAIKIKRNTSYTNTVRLSMAGPCELISVQINVFPMFSICGQASLKRLSSQGNGP